MSFMSYALMNKGVWSSFFTRNCTTLRIHLNYNQLPKKFCIFIDTSINLLKIFAKESQICIGASGHILRDGIMIFLIKHMTDKLI